MSFKYQEGMVQLDARQEYPPSTNSRRTADWWVWILVAIAAIIILWLVLETRTDIQPPQQPTPTQPTPAQPEVIVQYAQVETGKSRYLFS